MGGWIEREMCRHQMHLASPAVVLTYNGLHSGSYLSKIAAERAGVIVKAFEVYLSRASQALSLRGVWPVLKLRVNKALGRRTGPCSASILISGRPVGALVRRDPRRTNDVSFDVTLLHFGNRLPHSHRV